MPPLNRRQFFTSAALAVSSLAEHPGLLLAGQSISPRTGAKARRSMKVTDIETHEVLLPYDDYHATTLFRYHGLGVQLRTIYIVKTENGLEGYGESWWPAPKKNPFAQYIGTDPFDWMADANNLPMNMALYDLMGKFLGLPAWKLLGKKVRSWVPVSAWTISQTPDAMAEEVLSVSKRGYHWMKYHVDVLQNVIDPWRCRKWRLTGLKCITTLTLTPPLRRFTRF